MRSAYVGAIRPLETLGLDPRRTFVFFKHMHISAKLTLTWLEGRKSTDESAVLPR